MERRRHGEDFTRNKEINITRLDEKWYRRFEQFGAVEACEYLSGDKAHRTEQKRAFLAGEKRNPTLDYPKIDFEKLNTNEAALLELRKDIESEEQNEFVKQLYGWRINESIAQLRLLRVSKKAESGEDVEGEMLSFQMYSEFIYGEPSKDIYQYTLQSIQDQVQNALSSEHEELRTAALELEKVLPIIEDGVAKLLPASEEIAQVQEEAQRTVGDLIDFSFDEGVQTLNAHEIQDVFTEALNRLDADGWEAVILEDKTSISVSQKKKKVQIPASRELTVQRVQELIAHEIGTHVA